MPHLSHHLLHLRQTHQRDVLGVLLPPGQGDTVAVEQ
ncbi:hypothetical protein E2C01_028004 [Portunus trituberculatus]|uniref:Uncharacterized protein n=1 Tax=Portunus trituberculatus TaxID=210409 RepID=A0A5B7EN60_PORTR|nr:hypothetical protein [Portunus trituberculatus]